jgi:hypothetical protein
MSSQTGTCHRCGRELRGAIETNFMSLGRLVCITTIETPDCNWTQCRTCKKSVCKSCYVALSATCTDCFVSNQFPLKSPNTSGNGTNPDGPDPSGPIPFKKAA